MATASLNAMPRTESGKGVARKLRAAGQVPGIIYGHGRDPQSLTIGHSFHVSDLKLPEGVEVTDEADQTVVIVSAPKAEEVVAPVAVEGAAPTEAAPEPELIRKPKAGEEEGEESES